MRNIISYNTYITIWDVVYYNSNALINMNPIYSKQGEEQYVDVRVKFRIEHSPNTEFHLKKLLILNGIKGEVVEEGGKLVMYI